MAFFLPENEDKDMFFCSSFRPQNGPSRKTNDLNDKQNVWQFEMKKSKQWTLFITIQM